VKKGPWKGEEEKDTGCELQKKGLVIHGGGLELNLLQRGKVQLCEGVSG